MTEERETRIDEPQGHAGNHTTIVHERRSTSAGTWLLVGLAIVALAAAVWAFSTMGGAETAKDNAIADAAGEVGQAADQIGDAAQNVGDAVQQD
jgi:hypothetical protein